MKPKEKKIQKKSKKCSISILLNVIAVFVALFGAALLADNIYMFKSAVDQYVMQGYLAEDVMKSLVPAQLLPAIFESVALYGGMTFALLGISSAVKRISNLNTFECDADVEEELANEMIDEQENIEKTNEENNNEEDSNDENIELKK